MAEVFFNNPTCSTSHFLYGRDVSASEYLQRADTGYAQLQSAGIKRIVREEIDKTFCALHKRLDRIEETYSRQAADTAACHREEARRQAADVVACRQEARCQTSEKLSKIVCHAGEACSKVGRESITILSIFQYIYLFCVRYIRRIFAYNG